MLSGLSPTSFSQPSLKFGAQQAPSHPRVSSDTGWKSMDQALPPSQKEPWFFQWVLRPLARLFNLKIRVVHDVPEPLSEKEASDLAAKGLKQVDDVFRTLVQDPLPEEPLTEASEYKGVRYQAQRDPLTLQTFAQLANASGWDTITQDAIKENKRLPYLISPKPINIVARVADKIVGIFGGINFGEFGFAYPVMVDKASQNKGIATYMMGLFRHELERENGGPTSVAGMSADPDNLDTPSQTWSLNRGMNPLPNAVFLRRGNTLKGRNQQPLVFA